MGKEGIYGHYPLRECNSFECIQSGIGKE